jgi:hypothetical protein
VNVSVGNKNNGVIVPSICANKSKSVARIKRPVMSPKPIKTSQPARIGNDNSGVYDAECECLDGAGGKVFGRTKRGKEFEDAEPEEHNPHTNAQKYHTIARHPCGDECVYVIEPRIEMLELLHGVCPFFSLAT